MKKNNITELFKIQYPIIQGGMVWASGSKLAAAVSNAGGLGVIGAGSMQPELLMEHIQKAQTLTKAPLAVNFPLLYTRIEEQIKVALDLDIQIFITSAGSPKKFTQFLKDQGRKVIHVTSTPELARKCEDAGVDAIVAEGFEAGGHNGRDEITTMALIPQVVDAVKIPVIAAGGIADGRGIAAALCLGAQGVQMGTRFLMTQESSAHTRFKNLLLKAEFNSTMLALKKHVPVRLFKNAFYEKIHQLELQGADLETLTSALGKGRAKLGMFEGDLEEGELEIGQICSMIKDIPTVEELMQNLLTQYQQTIREFL
jgi:enoyl-[acyl-carrier protein] reductase II